MKFILFKKKKKIQNLPHAVCVQRAWTKQKKSQIFLNSWRERQRVRERERENPKAESLKRWNPCCEVRRPPPVTARSFLTAPLTPADCCCRRRRRSVTPRAIRLSGSALRSGMFLFCFVFCFFFLFLSFFSGSATSLLLTALPTCLVVLLLSCLLISCLVILYLTES